MNLLSTILATGGAVSGAAAVVGVTMQATVGDATFPWDKVGSAGIAGAVVLVGGYFLRRESAIRAELAVQHATEMRERDGVIKEVAEKFGDTATTITRTFADSTTAAEVRAQQREQRLHELLERITKD